ncbi:hypothetical protein QTH53_01770 [Clostridium perfringens]|nr:hypothetical protein [Clostridium perfringens]MDU6980770.1 hypothetical protein [Clostridium perfringens]
MEFFKKHRFSFYSIGVLIVTTVILILIHKIYGNYFEYSEWIKFCVGSLISILGFVATIFTIKLTIKTMNDKEKNNRLKKRMIAIVLEFEIEDFLFSFLMEFYSFLKLWNGYQFEDGKRPAFCHQRLKKISPEFKEKLYELITIEEKKECLDLLRFYKDYIECINDIEKIDFKELKLENTYYSLNTVLKIFETCFNEEYVKYSKMLSYRIVGYGYRHIPMNQEEKVEASKFFYKMDKVINEYKHNNAKKLTSNEYSKKFNGILQYLNSLK